jgi:hypothetical protein
MVKVKLAPNRMQAFPDFLAGVNTEPEQHDDDEHRTRWNH